MTSKVQILNLDKDQLNFMLKNHDCFSDNEIKLAARRVVQIRKDEKRRVVRIRKYEKENDRKIDSVTQDGLFYDPA